MHSSLISRVASIDADSFVHFAKEIPQRAANLYVDEAYSPANMADGEGYSIDVEPPFSAGQARHWDVAISRIPCWGPPPSLPHRQVLALLLVWVP